MIDPTQVLDAVSPIKARQCRLDIRFERPLTRNYDPSSRKSVKYHRNRIDEFPDPFFRTQPTDVSDCILSLCDRTNHAELVCINGNGPEDNNLVTPTLEICELRYAFRLHCDFACNGQRNCLNQWTHPRGQRRQRPSFQGHQLPN